MKIAGSAIKDVIYKLLDAVFGIDYFGALGHFVDTVFDNLIKLTALSVSYILDVLLFLIALHAGLQVVALFCAVITAAAFLNWDEAKIVVSAFWGEAVGAGIPVWVALLKAAPAVWEVVSKPVNIILYLIAFGGLVRYPYVLAGIVAAMTGKAPVVVVPVPLVPAAPLVLLLQLPCKGQPGRRCSICLGLGSHQQQNCDPSANNLLV